MDRPRLSSFAPTLLGVVMAFGRPAPIVAQPIVISQIYAGGGNAGAPWRNDFIELFNAGATPVSLSGWSVQYSSATGVSWQKTDLSGTIPVGGYYLVQEASGGSPGSLLPLPDVFGSITMNAMTGKVALARVATLLPGSCPLSNPDLIDLVGYGTATNCSETSPTGVNLSATLAAWRLDSGCRDTNNNAADFTAALPNPRNSASPPHPCPLPPSADLAVAVSVTPRIANQLSMTVVEVVSLTNRGPDDAPGTMLSVALPAGLTFQSVNTSQGSAGYSNGAVQASLGTLSAGVTATVTITQRTVGEGTFTTSASASSSRWDPVSVNNSASVSHYVALAAPLIVGLNDAATPIYAINPANGITVPLLSGISVGALAGDEAGRVLYAIGDAPNYATLYAIPYDTLIPSTPIPVTYDGASRSIAGLAFANRRLYGSATSASGTGPEGIYEIDPATGATTLVMSLQAVASGVDFGGFEFNAADGLFYVTNDASTGGTGLYSVDLFGSRQIELIAPYPTFTGDGGPLSRDIDGLAVGGGRAYFIVDQPGQFGVLDLATRTALAPIANPWTVLHTEAGGAWAPGIVAPRIGANLNLNQFDTADPVQQGSETAYVTTVTNLGPSQATGVVIRDTLPAGAEFVWTDITRGSAVESQGTVTGSVGTLAPGDSAVLIVDVRLHSVGVTTNVATVSANQTDPVPDDNIAAARTLVTGGVDLSVSQFDSPDPVAAVGDDLTYVIGVANIGAVTADGVVLGDTFTAHMQFVSATTDRGIVTHQGNTLTVAIGPLAAGENATVTLIVRPTTMGQVVNHASAASGGVDPNPTNDSSTELTTIVRRVAPLIVGVWDTTAYVHALDVNSGVANPLFNGIAVEGLAADDIDRILWVSDGNRLYRVSYDAPYNATAVGGFHGAASNISGLAFHSRERRLYGTRGANLLEIDPATAATTLRWSVFGADFGGLDYDPVTDRLYATSDSTSTAPPHNGRGLYAIDPAVPALTKMASYPFKSGTTLETDIDACAAGDGRIYLCTDETQWAYAYDLATHSYLTPFAQPFGASSGAAGAAYTTELMSPPPGANLSVAILNRPDPLGLDQDLEYQYTIVNLGPDTASGATLVATVPDTILFLYAAATQGAVTYDNGLIVAEFGDLYAGQAATVVATLRTTLAGVVTNSAVVASLAPDAHPENNSASATSTIVPPGCTALPADINRDGRIDALDIQGFVGCLLAGGTPFGLCACADLNASNTLDSDDASAFAAQLIRQ